MSIKVLLVDDEEDFTEILSERMKSRGLDVDIANTGSGAIKIMIVLWKNSDLNRSMAIFDPRSAIGKNV